uniref:ATP synthase subunit b n=1 Tax=Desulfomonile tiedjei TaxID=2358 RepID=A0A7C4EVC4_9BACT
MTTYFLNRESRPVINVNVTLFVQIVNFLVLLIILNAILYKPIKAKIQERESKIKKDLDEALLLEKKVEDQERKHQEELARARQTAAQEKADLMADAKKVEADLLDQARARASAIVDEMRASIQSEASEVRKTLKEDMTPLAKSISEKILGRAV